MFQIVWIIFTKINGAGVGKLKAVPIDLDKLSDVIDNQVVKNTKFNTLKTKVINLEQKIPEATTLIDINQHNTDEQNLEQKIKDVDKKMPDISGLVNTTALNTEKSEVDNKITAKTFKEKLKQTDSVSKNNFDNKLISFNKRITLNKTKYLEVQKKLNSLKIKDYIFFLGAVIFTIKKGTDYALSLKSKGVYTSKRKALYTAFLHSIKLSGYRMGIKFDKNPLAVEQKNHLTKIVNLYIVYDLDA